MEFRQKLKHSGPGSSEMTNSKVPKYSDTRKHCTYQPKIQTMRTHLRLFCQKDAHWIANSADPDQTSPLGAVWPWSALSALFAQTYLSENLGSLPQLSIYQTETKGILSKWCSRSSLIWVCTVCPDLSVRKLRVITVMTFWKWAALWENLYSRFPTRSDTNQATENGQRLGNLD